MTTQDLITLLNTSFWTPYCYECRDTGNKYYTGHREDCRECGGHIKKLKACREAIPAQTYTVDGKEFARTPHGSSF